MDGGRWPGFRGLHGGLELVDAGRGVDVRGVGERLLGFPDSLTPRSQGPSVTRPAEVSAGRRGPSSARQRADASVDREHRAGEVGPGARCEEDGGAHDIILSPYTLQRGLGDDPIGHRPQRGGHHP
jgi:hypothetical protein